MLTLERYTVSMVRTQIQLSEEDYGKLRQIAKSQGRSMADCIREGIGLFLRRSHPDFDLIPSFRRLPDDDLKDHDRWWAEAAL